jgi:hypothetical protein
MTQTEHFEARRRFHNAGVLHSAEPGTRGGGVEETRQNSAHEVRYKGVNSLGA